MDNETHGTDVDGQAVGTVEQGPEFASSESSSSSSSPAIVNAPHAADMTVHIGTKVLRSIPMTLGDYNTFRGWTQPANEDPNAPGYLVEYKPDGTPNVDGFKGYVSWSPASAFERSYRPVKALTFGYAIEAMKAGHRVARRGWNGKGMFAYIVPAASYPVQTGAAKAHFGEGALVPYRAYLALKTVDDDVATWAPSCSDVLAEDWELVD